MTTRSLSMIISLDTALPSSACQASKAYPSRSGACGSSPSAAPVSTVRASTLVCSPVSPSGARNTTSAYSPPSTVWDVTEEYSFRSPSVIARMGTVCITIRSASTSAARRLIDTRFFIAHTPSNFKSKLGESKTFIRDVNPPRIFGLSGQR